MQTKTLSGFQLSPQQKRLWLLQQNSSAYLTQCALLIEGDLNLEVFKAALQQVIERHAILRTSFRRPSGRKFPVMVVADQGAYDWQEVDLSDRDQQEQAARIEELFLAVRRREFDWERLPLLHLTLLRLSTDMQVLHVCLPAFCVDTRTIKTLAAEISRAYSACLKGEGLVGEVVQYLQFSEWQNQLLTDQEAGAAREYWRQQKSPSLATLSLPFERKSSKQAGFEPNSVSLAIAPGLTATIEALAQKTETSTAIVLLACWQTLIWRLTGRPDTVVIGVASDRREYEELHEVVGLLATWLPIRTQLVPDLRFQEVIELVARALDDVEEWQDYFVPEPEGNGDSMVFPISFEFEEFPPKYIAGDVSISLYKQSSFIESFKLKLTCSKQNGSLQAAFYYDTNYFSADTIQRLAGHCQTLLATAAENPETVISQVEILTQPERQHLLVELNQTQVDYSKRECIHQLFEAQTIATPDKVAVIFEDYQLTYAELNARANQLAHYLQKLGIGPDRLVGIFMSRSLEVIVALLGVLKAGGAYLPLDPALPVEGLNLRLREANVSVLLTQQRLFEKLPTQSARIVLLDQEWEAISRCSEVNPASQATSKNLAYVLFTSGSTGRPKGVEIEHQSLFNYVKAIVARLDLPADANFATVSTFAADLGNTVIFPALSAGGCLHVVSQARASDPATLADYFYRYSMDCLKIVPSHLTALLDASSTQSILPDKYLILGGEAVSWELIEKIRQRCPNCQVFNHYGPTETTVGSLTYAIELQGETSGDSASDTVPIGRPLANTQVYVLDRQLQLAPMGVSGELYIGGAGLARGYLNRPELTKERFISNPFTQEIRRTQDEIGNLPYLERLYKTGDLVRYLPEGNLEFLGRIDNQVKVRGFRIELGEIEASLKQHVGVRDVVVLAREDKPGDKRLVAYVVSNPGRVSGVSELQLFLRKQLPEYMAPSAFVLLKNLPLNSNGKVDRQSLPAPDTIRPDLEATFVAPRTPVEASLAGIWAEVLRLERVGVHDDFFDLGGHSLLVTQVVSRLRDIFEADLSLNDFFEAPTVANLAVLITQKLAEETDREMLAEAFAELEQLSEEEAQAALTAANEELSSQEGGIK